MVLKYLYLSDLDTYNGTKSALINFPKLNERNSYFR